MKGLQMVWVRSAHIPRHPLPRRIASWLLLIACFLAPWRLSAESAAPLTSLRAIADSPEVKSGASMRVEFPATVTYYRGYERTLFVQDQGKGIFVLADPDLALLPGDRVLIDGITQGSFRPMVISSHVAMLQHGNLPPAMRATFDQMIRGAVDSNLVTVRGVIRSADINYSSNQLAIQLKLACNGGDVDAIIDSTVLSRYKALLDSEVDVTGVEGGRFDGKMNQVGVILHVPLESNIKVVRPSGRDPWSLPIVPMGNILKSYHVVDQSTRVHVQGTLTYQQVGSAIVLQNKEHSLWVKTDDNNLMRPGDIVDATGFPDIQNGFLVLDHADVLDRYWSSPVTPFPATWNDLTGSKHAFDLVSIQGTVVSALREPTQDNYVLEMEGHSLSAVVRHRAFDAASLAAFKTIAAGSIVRATGVCVPGDSNPYNPDVPFNILMNSPSDLVVLAPPSWITPRNLLRIVAVLVLLVLAAGAWGWTLRRRVRIQSAALAKRAEAEATLQRRIAYLEQRRRRIIEEINGDVPLGEILDQIAETTSLHLDNAPCWFEAPNGKRYGQMPEDTTSLRLVQVSIIAPSGTALGAICAAVPPETPLSADAEAALNEGARVATLAIETRRLYADLRQRSDFDQLTDLHNRSYLERHIEMLIADAHHTGSAFALIYIDLDRFKDVNDQFGHHIGDLYLQEAARRMKKQLRGADLLSRLGGDEFIAITPGIEHRTELHDIMHRLQRCFEEDFLLETYVIRGSASFGIALFPGDAITRDGLLRCADAMMYESKRTKATDGRLKNRI